MCENNLSRLHASETDTVSEHQPPQEESTAPVRIDRSDFVQRHRYRCPNGHSSWEPTNSHIWCPTCRRQWEHRDRDVDAEHYHVVDDVTGEEIHWSRVVLVR